MEPGQGIAVSPPPAQSLAFQKILTPSRAEHGPEGVLLSKTAMDPRGIFRTGRDFPVNGPFSAVPCMTVIMLLFLLLLHDKTAASGI